MSSSHTESEGGSAFGGDVAASGTPRAEGGPASGGDAGASGTPRLVDVTMPQMGVSVSEGTIVEWRKQVGDWVAYEEAICDISTDKIDTEVPSPAAGRVTKLLVDVGTTVSVGTVLARIATDARPGEAHAAEQSEPPTSVAAAAKGETPAEATPDPAPEPGTATPDEAPVARHRNGHAARRYSPVVLRIAQEHGVDLEQVEGTGLRGRVRKQDVLAYIESQAAVTAAGEPSLPVEPPLHIESPYRPEPAPARRTPAPAATGQAEQLSRMRQAIGRQMRHALDTAAHCTTIVECDVSRVERRRRELGITALPLVARCVVETLREFPSLNATLDGETITRHEDVNLGIAVSLGEDGLIVPVVARAQELSPEGLASRIRDLATRAREKRLEPDEVQLGTFTITNPGAYGAIAATPVINVPQVAILDLEAIVKRAVVLTDDDGNDSIAIRPMTNLCMSWDHRAIDGAYAAQFLTALRHRIEAV